MEKKPRTVNFLKDKRHVPETVIEARKHYIKMRKTLLEALKDEDKTVPQLSKATGISLPDTMYYLMTLLKFGDVSVGGIDDMDEYYIYQLKNK